MSLEAAWPRVVAVVFGYEHRTVDPVDQRLDPGVNATNGIGRPMPARSMLCSFPCIGRRPLFSNAVHYTPIVWPHFVEVQELIFMFTIAVCSDIGPPLVSASEASVPSAPNPPALCLKASISGVGQLH